MVPVIVIVASVATLAAYGPLPGLLLFFACRFLMPLPFLASHHRIMWWIRWAWRRYWKTEIASAGVLACASERGFAMVEHVPAWKGAGLFARAWRNADDAPSIPDLVVFAVPVALEHHVARTRRGVGEVA